MQHCKNTVGTAVYVIVVMVIGVGLLFVSFYSATNLAAAFVAGDVGLQLFYCLLLACCVVGVIALLVVLFD